MSPRRPKSACTEPGCRTLSDGGRCPKHKQKPWANSTRRSRVGKTGWQQQTDAQRILDRHGRICHVCGRPGADQVDHVIALAHGGLDVDDNKRPIHSSPCHTQKTANESRRSRGGIA